MEKIENVDCMKYRKSTHLAGVDVDAIIAEKGQLIVTIKNAYYGKGIEMNGKKSDGYFIEFVEELKPMSVNSGNRKTISNIVKVDKNLSSVDSRNCENWKGQKIELYFEPNRSFAGQLTGGIGVKITSPIPNISDTNAITILNGSKTILELQINWSKLNPQEQALPTVNALKDKLKTTLK